MLFLHGVIDVGEFIYYKFDICCNYVLSEKVSMDLRLECFKILGAGVATISLVGAGAGVGIVFGSLLLSISRNPNVKGELFSYAILGFALTEAVGLLGLMMSFLLLFR